MHENKRDQEILYTLTIPQASTKDSGIYSCSITDIISNESQTKQLAVRVFGMKAALCLLPAVVLKLFLASDVEIDEDSS